MFIFKTNSTSQSLTLVIDEKQEELKDLTNNNSLRFGVC